MRKLTLLLLCLAASAQARPYRAMVTRTAESTKQGNLEVGLRYQGFFLGDGGPLGPLGVLPWHQVAAHARFGILDSLEVETQLEVLLEKQPGSPQISAFLGDIPLGVQWTFINQPKFALGLFGRVTLPTGPSAVDLLPPTVSDGTWDAEATLIAEVRPTRNIRLMANLGFLYYGVRHRPSGDFGVPEGVRYDFALTANVTRWLLLSVELVGRSFFSRVLTPVWRDNQHLIEISPGVRLETIPRLVIEAALGIAITRDLQQIYLLRPLLGLTYEFEL